MHINFFKKKKKESGFVLLVVLVLLILLVAGVSEFAYEVYTSYSLLHNWENSEKLRILADSASEIAIQIFIEQYLLTDYTHFRIINLPLPITSEENISIKIEDEQAKFNLNSLIYPNGNDNKKAIEIAKRLFRKLDIEETLIDRIADWIDPDTIERLQDSEKYSKNRVLYSIEELKYIKGFNNNLINKISEYITVFGDRSSEAGKININTAKSVLIMSLVEGLDESIVENIINYREKSPFRSISELRNVAGIGPFFQELSSRCVVKSKFFKINITASVKDLFKTIIKIVKIENNTTKLLFYREF